MYESAVYDGEKFVGDVRVWFNDEMMNLKVKLKGKMRISYYSTPSERCSPLAALSTVSSHAAKVCLKMESKNRVDSNSLMKILHSTCYMEKKTAVVSLGEDELHLVPMCSRTRRSDVFPCFWGFVVPLGLYESCLVMLNLRCLSIVFDLDETLIVANTLRSFEVKIEDIKRRLCTEPDPQRIAGMLSEVKRYEDDRKILKQYAESDQIVEYGKVSKAEPEVVDAVSTNHERLVRPVIRLQEKKIVLTRINPRNRDTSVLVRLRPAWEDLRSYLVARGRKRFEVYVCTMAEREYALEMWRLLDPDSNLINIKELSNRIVCVKSGSKKSLSNVFQHGNCHPKMALVIDDRLKVWDERDQPRVHVVPAFSPYYAPQAEANCDVPILCVARNVACSIRGGFFKDFDEGLLQRINEVAYEDEIKDILPPDVSNYLISEAQDDGSALNGSKEPLGFNIMADLEVERRLKETISSSTIAPFMPELDPILKTPFWYNPAPAPAPAPAPMPIVPPVPIVQCRNNHLPSTKLNRQETSLHTSTAKEDSEMPSELDPDTRRRLLILQHGMDTRSPPVQVSAPRVGRFPSGEDMVPRELNQIEPPLKDFSLRPEPMHTDKKHPLCAPPFVHNVEASILPKDNESGGNDTFSESPAEYLHYVAFKCGTEAEFRQSLVPSTELQFNSEVWFAGEKIGDGTGRTRREAQHNAAESSLMSLADKYLSFLKSGDKGRLDIPKQGSIAALNELCMMEGLGMTFQYQPQVPTNTGLNKELYAQVEIDGEVWGKGVGLTWDEAKTQAAETAFTNLKAKIAQHPQKRQLSSRSFQEMPTKRFRPE